MPYDANLLFTSTSGTTGTASMTHGTVDLKTGTPTRGLYARWLATAGSASSGTAKAYPQYDHSSDAVTWHALTDGTAEAMSLTSAGSLVKEVLTPINTKLRYVRQRTVVVGGTGPTLNVYGDLGIARTP